MHNLWKQPHNRRMTLERPTCRKNSVWWARLRQQSFPHVRTVFEFFFWWICHWTWTFPREGGEGRGNSIHNVYTTITKRCYSQYMYTNFPRRAGVVRWGNIFCCDIYMRPCLRSPAREVYCDLKRSSYYFAPQTRCTSFCARSHLSSSDLKNSRLLTP